MSFYESWATGSVPKKPSAKFPYFKWYAAEAEADEAWISMTYEERGVFVTVLDRAWNNNGLPNDLDELARTLGIPKVKFLKMWQRIGLKFVLRGNRLFNSRQEEERSKVSEKSSKAKLGGYLRWGNENDAKAMRSLMRSESVRSPDALLPAYDSGSISGSSSEEEGPGETMSEVEIDDFAAWAEEIYQRHPKQANKWHCLQALMKYFAQDLAARGIFEQNYPAWLEHWKAGDSRFTPALAKADGTGFIPDEAWKKPPPVAVSAKQTPESYLKMLDEMAAEGLPDAD